MASCRCPAEFFRIADSDGGMYCINCESEHFDGELITLA